METEAGPEEVLHAIVLFLTVIISLGQWSRVTQITNRILWRVTFKYQVCRCLFLLISDVSSHILSITVHKLNICLHVFCWSI